MSVCSNVSNNPVTEDVSDAEDCMLYFPDDVLLEHLGDEHVSSRTIGSFFLPSKRIPKKFLENIQKQSSEEFEKVLTGETPLMHKDFSFKYWEKDNLPYDRMRIELFGSVGLSDDRSTLDAIIGMGSQLVQDEGYIGVTTLQDVIMSLDMDVDYRLLQVSPLQPLPYNVTWYHIETSRLLSHLGLANKTPNKVTLKKRIERISKMQFFLRYFSGDIELANPKRFQIVSDGGLFFILDRNKLSNPDKYSPDTFTDVLIGISSGYRDELPKDGFLSRKRLHEVYPVLNKKSKVIDFLKFIDSNLRNFTHQKYLTWMISRYFESHPAAATGQNMSHVKYQLFTNMIEQSDLLHEHFNLILKKVEVEDGKLSPRYNGIDYQFIYDQGEEETVDADA